MSAQDVFVVITEDRRSGTQVDVWTDREAAIAMARAIAVEQAERTESEVEEYTIPGLEYYARYAQEFGAVHVVRVAVKIPKETQCEN